MGNNKRKRTYIDRSQVLSGLSKPSNVIEGVVARACDTTTVGSLERHFKHKLVADKEIQNDGSLGCTTVVLTAMVMRNELCVLVCSAPCRVDRLEYVIAADSEAISGKRKKGAKYVAAGRVIARITRADGSVAELVTPVGGQLLETNDRLADCPALLWDQPAGTGYVAVVYPDTDVPGLGDAPKAAKEQHANPNVCFAFLRGKCARGDSCKFDHSEEPPPVAP
jgi:hypothetical protein